MKAHNMAFRLESLDRYCYSWIVAESDKGYFHIVVHVSCPSFI